MSNSDLGSVSSSPLSYSEEKAWSEFCHDRETFFKRGSLLAVPLDDHVDDRSVSDLVNAVTQRHEILRTAYDGPGGAGSRHVLPSYQHEIRVADEMMYPVDGAHESCVMPGDVVRIWLTPGADGRRTLYFDMNEMITDTGSTARLNDEVGKILAGDGGPLGAAPPATYAEYAVEQRQEPLPVGTVEYWAKTLEGMRPHGSIPDEGPDPSGDIAGERVLVFPDECTAGFRRLCQQYRMSPFMAVVALVNVSMAAIWELTELTLATAASARPARYGEVLGNFTTNLLLPSALGPSPTLHAAAVAARGTVMGTLRHSAPVRKIAEVLGSDIDMPPIRLHYLASGDHYYSLLDAKPSGAAWKEPAEFPGWPLEVGFAEDSRRRVAVWLQYDPRRFHHERVQEIMFCLQTLLGASAAGDDTVDATWLRSRLPDREPFPD